MGQPTLPLPPPKAFLRLFRGNALDAHIMGDTPPAWFDQIHLGGGDLHNNSPGRFEGVFAHGLFTPFLGQCACCPHHGQLPTLDFFWLISKHTTINLILCILFLFFPSPLLLAWTDLNLLFQIEILS
jgi:hypothetical protein